MAPVFQGIVYCFIAQLEIKQMFAQSYVNVVHFSSVERKFVMIKLLKQTIYLRTIRQHLERRIVNIPISVKILVIISTQ
jgi:Ni,Fe-hydrogenase I cytochrome b subunit